jgi:hypothetical protein
MFSTLGVTHSEDLPVKLCAELNTTTVIPSFLNGIISINERETFRDKLIAE